MVYAVRGGEIVPLGRGEEVPQWSGAWLGHTVAFTRRHLEAGGIGWAAELQDRPVRLRDRPAGSRGRPAREDRPACAPGLAGVAVLAGLPVGGDAGLLQLALLHVGRGYRRSGLASMLFARACEEAALRGARRLYISATPFEGALRFYLSRGARLADPPDPTLLKLEPEDVHLVLDL
jgi:GNAT superfamily N-acetyltransferase